MILLQSLLTLAIIVIGLYFLTRYPKTKAINKADGSFVMKLPPLFLYLIGYPTLLLGLVALLGLFLDLPIIDFSLDSAFISMVFIPLGIYFVLICHNHQVIFNEETVQVRNIWGKRKTITWTAIKKVNYDPNLTGMLYLETEKEKVAISHFGKGFIELRDQLVEHSKVALPPALTKLKQIGK